MITLIYTVDPKDALAEKAWLNEMKVYPSYQDYYDWIKIPRDQNKWFEDNKEYRKEYKEKYRNREDIKSKRNSDRKERKKIDKVSDYEATGKMKTNVAFLKIPVANIKLYFKKPGKLKLKSEKGVSFVPKGAMSINLNNLFSENNFTIIDNVYYMASGQCHYPFYFTLWVICFDRFSTCFIPNYH